MNIVSPSSIPRLVQALGPGALVVTIAGAVQAADRHGAVTIRRARGNRDPIGSPASCSLAIGVDSPPTWVKGDPVTVKLSEAALTALYGSANVVDTNLFRNPGFEVNTSSWVALSTGTLTRDTSTMWDGTASCRVNMPGTNPNAEGIRSSPTASTAAVTGARVLVELAIQVPAGQQVKLELAMTSVPSPANRLLPATTYTGTGQWETLELDGIMPGNNGSEPVLGITAVGQTAGQARLFYVDQGSMVINPSTPNVGYFDGGTSPEPNQGVTYAWTGTANASTSTRTYSPATVKAQARYRFSGRITDLDLETTRTTATANVIATGFLAALGATDVGDVPWPAEAVHVRVGRVLAAAKAKDPAIVYQVDSLGGTPTIPAQDVDKQSAQSLLEALSETTSPASGMWEKRDGTLVWADGFSNGLFPQLVLGSEAVAMPLRHEQADRVNRVVVTPQGKPTVGQLLYINQLTNPSFETNTTGYQAQGTSTAIARVTTQFDKGAASLACTIGPDAGVFLRTTALTSYGGANMRVRSRVRPPVAVELQMAIRYLAPDGATTTAYRYGPKVTVAANTWTELSAEGIAPADTAFFRVYWFRTLAAATGQVVHVDSCGAFDGYGGIPPLSLPYFDGSSTTPAEYTYAWEGTAHASRSFAKATANTPALSYTLNDPESQALYGVLADQVASQVDVGAAGWTWASLVTRASDQMLEGGWKPPAMPVDVLPLLLDPAQPEYVSGHETPKDAAAAALRAELGSIRQLYTTGSEPSAMPDLEDSNVITSLTEVITPHRWTITTEAERTY